MKKIIVSKKKKGKVGKPKKEILTEVMLAQEKDAHFHIRVPTSFKLALERLQLPLNPNSNYYVVTSDSSLIIKLVREELLRRKLFDKVR